MEEGRRVLMKKLLALMLTATLVISVGAVSVTASEIIGGAEETITEESIVEPTEEETIDTDEVVEAEETEPEEEVIVPAETEETVEEIEEVEESSDIAEEEPAIEEPTVAEETSEVPNYVGMNESDIEDIVNGTVESNVVINYVPLGDSAAGTVVGQTVLEDGRIVIEIASEEAVGADTPMKMNLLGSFGLNADMGTDAPSLANGGWENYAHHYDNDNMNQSQSAATWGAWAGNGNLQGQKYDDVENNDLCHLFGLYADGDNVHIYIKYSALYNGIANGNDYQLRVDGDLATYRVILDDGRDITYTQLEPGTYNLKIYNDHCAISGSEVLGASGQIVIKEGNLHNEMEVVIPMSALKDQNGDINLDSYSVISFFTPNLMERELACGGASSGPVIFGVMTLIVFLGAILWAKKKGILEGYYVTEEI